MATEQSDAKITDTKKINEAAAEAAERAALTPEQRLGKDWPKKHKQLAPYITELGKVRGNLNIPDQKQARKKLKSYGFEV